MILSCLSYFLITICANNSTYKSTSVHKIYRYSFMKCEPARAHTRDFIRSSKDKRKRHLHMHLHVAQMEFLLRPMLSPQLLFNAIALFLLCRFETADFFKRMSSEFSSRQNTERYMRNSALHFISMC